MIDGLQEVRSFATMIDVDRIVTMHTKAKSFRRRDRVCDCYQHDQFSLNFLDCSPNLLSGNLIRHLIISIFLQNWDCQVAPNSLDYTCEYFPVGNAYLGAITARQSSPIRKRRCNAQITSFPAAIKRNWQRENLQLNDANLRPDKDRAFALPELSLWY
jgi:hypothetical protein